MHIAHILLDRGDVPVYVLATLMAAAVYFAHLSTSQEQPKQLVSVLVQCLAQVKYLTPGYVQLVTIGVLSFIHLHPPSGKGKGIAVTICVAMLRNLRPHLQGLPALAGDVNCVVHQVGTEDHAFIIKHKFVEELSDTV